MFAVHLIAAAALILKIEEVVGSWLSRTGGVSDANVSMAPSMAVQCIVYLIGVPMRLFTLVFWLFETSVSIEPYFRDSLRDLILLILHRSRSHIAHVMVDPVIFRGIFGIFDRSFLERVSMI